MKKGTNLPACHDRQIDALIFVYFIFEKAGVFLISKRAQLTLFHKLRR